jgi:hypothetical protein
MTRILSSTVAAIALAGLVSVSALTPQQQQRQRDDQTLKAKTVTVIGCITKSDPKSAQGSTAPFVLTNVERGTASTYALIPTPGADLASHVNHKVEITGAVPRQPQPGAGPERSSESTRGTGGDMPSLAVQSVKMIANSCTS